MEADKSSSGNGLARLLGSQSRRVEPLADIGWITVNFRTRWWTVLLLLLCCQAWSQSWTVLGPDGGDARSLAYDPTDPDHIWLGTGTSTVFISTNGGKTWERAARLGTGDGKVIDHIVIDPKNTDTIYASAWSLDDHRTGDVFRSRDGGRTWEALPPMHDMPVRALTMAPSDPRILAAGTLQGVYLTRDGGESWDRISPEDHPDLRNIESIAIDPQDPDLIYAGTWHLAWKTSDGGKTWHRVAEGMIDDSDVFSIIVDPANSSIVFASACSGIYKSENRAELFQKVKGMPFSARRTRVLREDSKNPNVVYAGTTLGLWRTIDGGRTWRQIGSSQIVVNDILIDPRRPARLLLATDRGGVLASDDGGRSFYPSNRGYTHRYVTTILSAKDEPDTVLVGVAGDREWGGVFFFQPKTHTWQQHSNGLGGRDVLALKETPDGELMAGTNRGVFILDRKADAWHAINHVVDLPSAEIHASGRDDYQTSRNIPVPLMEAKINAVEMTRGLWLAATSDGLFVSRDEGGNWTGGSVLGKKDFISVQSRRRLLAVATRSEVLLSQDEGITWVLCSLPPVGSIRKLILSGVEGEILLASSEGGFRSSDYGRTWQRILNGLPGKDLSSITYDGSSRSLLATSLSTGVIFESNDGGRTWTPGPDSGYPLLEVKEVDGHLFGATPFDGLIVQQ
jgi:photosystem II stability/assembly factor-like uncharacterized protein